MEEENVVEDACLAFEEDMFPMDIALISKYQQQDQELLISKQKFPKKFKEQIINNKLIITTAANQIIIHSNCD
jgi:hypothetical protein